MRTAGYTQQTQRRSGVEMYKIIAMFLIVLCHVVQTLLLKKSHPLPFSSDYVIDISSSTKSVQKLLMVFFRCAGPAGNDMFFISSAFFLSGRKRFSSRKAQRLWADTWTISVIFLIIFSFTGIPLTGTLITKSLFPTVFASNWYISAYLLIYILHPVFNTALDHISGRYLLRLDLFFTALYVCLSLIRQDLLFSNNLLMLIIIYFDVAYLRRHRPDLTENVHLWRGIMILGWAGMALQILVTNALGFRFPFFDGMLFHWDSHFNPFCLMAALGSFYVFYNKNFHSAAVNSISALSLPVYLIHENILVRNYFRPWLWHIIYISFGYRYLILWVFAMAACIYAASCLLGVLYVRMLRPFVWRVSDRIFDAAEKLIQRILKRTGNNEK